MTPAKIRSSKTAKIVMNSSKDAAIFTPRMLMSVKIKNAKIAMVVIPSSGKNSLKYAPMANAIAGGAKTNSTSWAIPPTKPQFFPRARSE